MKPVELFKFLILNSTEHGETVLDGFAGSGTTLIACQMSGRTAKLIELDERYCDCIVKRFKKLFPDVEVKCIRDGNEIKWNLK